MTFRPVYAETGSCSVLQELEAQLVARTDHYSDFGTSDEPQDCAAAGSRDEALLAAGIGGPRVFRAPSLPDALHQQTRNTFELVEFDSGSPKSGAAR